MSANRLFSVFRRFPGFIDLLIRRRSGVDGYVVKAATNFDQSFSAVLTANTYGYIDPELRDFPIPPHNSDDVRVVFRPSLHSLSDTGMLWLQVAFTVGGVEQNAASADPPSAPTLVLPTDTAPTAMVGISGAAPAGANLAASLRIDLPSQGENFEILNRGSGDLFVSFDSSGPEFIVSQGDVIGDFYGTASSLWVRGAASLPFTITFARAFPR